MSYQIINTSRARHNRVQRATLPSRPRFKQYLGEDQLRSVRSRPMTVSAEWVQKNLEELRAKAALGLIEVRTGDGRVVDLVTLQAAPLPPETPQPNPPLDSAANDINGGIQYPKFVDGITPAEVSAQVDAAQRAALDQDVEETDPEEVAYTETPAATQTKQRGRRGR